MRPRCRSLAVAAALVFLSAGPALAGVTTGDPGTSGATGARAKVDLVPEPGADPAGSGKAHLTLDARRGQICFDIDLNKVDSVVAVHIHGGEAGETNEDLVVVDLDFGNLGFRGCTRAARHVVESIVDNVDSNDPAAFYLHVHTGADSTGSVRGQLERD